MSDNLEGVIKTVGDSNHKLSRCQEWDAHSIFTITDCSCELEPIAQHVRGLVVRWTHSRFSNQLEPLKTMTYLKRRFTSNNDITPFIRVDINSRYRKVT